MASIYGKGLCNKRVSLGFVTKNRIVCVYSVQGHDVVFERIPPTIILKITKIYSSVSNSCNLLLYKLTTKLDINVQKINYFQLAISSFYSFL